MLDWHNLSHIVTSSHSCDVSRTKRRCKRHSELSRCSPTGSLRAVVRRGREFSDNVIFDFPILDNDDLLGSVTADDRGIFCVRGATTEVTDIEPYIYIEHNCGYEGLDQKHYFIRAIPKEFITEGNFSKKTYHMGDIELLTKDAPVQHYQRRMLIHHHHSSHGPLSLHQQVMQCIPHYVAYKDYYEKVVVNGGTSQYNKTELEKQAWDDLLRKITGAPPSPPGISHTEDVHTHTETHTHVEDHRTHTESETHEVVGPVPVEPQKEHGLELEQEEELRRLEEEKRLEEERRREEQRRVEEERIREEQRRLDEDRMIEEQRRLDEERRLEEQRRHEEDRRIEEQRRLDEETRLEEQRRLDEEKRIEEERRLEEQRRLEEEKRKEGEPHPDDLITAEEEREREEEAGIREQHWKEEEERRKLEEERRRLEDEIRLAEEKRLKEEEEFRREEDKRYEEQRRREEEMRREEERLREEERRKEEEIRREEERRREEEYRRELDHRREEHNRRLEEFKKLEEQRKQEIERLEQERKMWMEKLKELEEGQKKKHLVQIICSRDNVVRTTQIREYTEGEDPCEGFRRT
ncbi:hypothetical protein Y032_0379g314 [Ancylostoma ceylanicum]|uniref:Transthyretin-like family protein n=1 Tax=Ancylostoma ceylanicum TaxID=53326 RepID=A0A016RTF2_9BILA|nr:hypothetical protein Y032_0379g314 [Ancylostoma ceylanicum]